MHVYIHIYLCVDPDHAIQGEGQALNKVPFVDYLLAPSNFLALKHTEIPEVSGAQHCLAMEKRIHLILMQGLLILNLDKVLDEVELHLRRLPLLLAILATDPPKSSSL